MNGDEFPDLALPVFSTKSRQGWRKPREELKDLRHLLD